MAEHMPGDPDAGDQFVRLDDGDMHVVENGRPGAPALLLIHGTGGSTAWWDPVVPRLAAAYVSSVSTCSATGGRRAPPAGTTSPRRPAGSAPRSTGSAWAGRR